jgi:prepilin-type N-terminal cleavage/methylation domain-containing protein
MKNKHKTLSFGFTLFELLVSISIIGILTAVVAFSFSSAQKKARDSRRVTDMNAIQKAAELYYAASGYSYPAAIPWVAGSGETVMAIYPTDPKNVAPYQYVPDHRSDGYCVCAKMENATGGNSSDSVCAFVSGGAYYCVKNQQ